MLNQELKTEITDFVAKLAIETPLMINGTCLCGEGLDDCACNHMELTIACNETGDDWNFQTGDNSFVGACYSLPHWSVVHISPESDRQAIAADVIDQLEDLLADQD